MSQGAEKPEQKFPSLCLLEHRDFATTGFGMPADQRTRLASPLSPHPVLLNNTDIGGEERFIPVILTNYEL